MKRTLVVISSNPIKSVSFEQGIEVALNLADAELEVQVLLEGDFLEYVQSSASEDVVIKKLKQLFLYEVEVCVKGKVESFDWKVIENKKSSFYKDFSSVVVF